MTYTEMIEAVEDAKRTLSRADTQIAAMSRMVRDRMRLVPGSVLEDMKRELRKFNMSTHEWQD